MKFFSKKLAPLFIVPAISFFVNYVPISKGCCFENVKQDDRVEVKDKKGKFDGSVQPFYLEEFVIGYHASVGKNFFYTVSGEKYFNIYDGDSEFVYTRLNDNKWLKKAGVWKKSKEGDLEFIVLSEKEVFKEELPFSSDNVLRVWMDCDHGEEYADSIFAVFRNKKEVEPLSEDEKKQWKEYAINWVKEMQEYFSRD